MSSIYFPDEILELIFSQVHDKTARPTRQSVSPLSPSTQVILTQSMRTVEPQGTFASLCLASKQFLPIARSDLYYRPIPSMEASWTHTIALHASLITHLARLVRSLHGIVEFVGGIEHDTGPNFPLSFELRGYTKWFSLYHALVSACPRLVAVDLSCDTMQALNAILEALEHSVPTLVSSAEVSGASMIISVRRPSDVLN